MSTLKKQLDMTAVAKQTSKALDGRETNAPSLAKPGGKLPEKLTKADGLTDAQQAFATTNISLMAYLRVQAMSAAGGEPVKDNFASDYSFAAVQSLGARDGLEAVEGMVLALVVLSDTRSSRPPELCILLR